VYRRNLAAPIQWASKHGPGWDWRLPKLLLAREGEDGEARRAPCHGRDDLKISGEHFGGEARGAAGAGRWWMAPGGWRRSWWCPRLADETREGSFIHPMGWHVATRLNAVGLSWAAEFRPSFAVWTANRIFRAAPIGNYQNPKSCK